jgi:predicted nucleic acid-binding protein
MATRAGERLFVDTNILIYLTNSESPWFQSAYEQIWKLWPEYNCCLSGQVLREYLVAATRNFDSKTRLSHEDPYLNFDLFQSSSGFLVLDENSLSRKIFNQLVRRFSPHGKEIHDTNIVATMLAHGIKRIWTHNIHDFKRYSSLIHIQPLETSQRS